MKFKVIFAVFLVFLALGCLLIQDESALQLFIWFTSSVFVSIISVGVIVLRFNFFVNATCHTNEASILITFDDGPHPVNTLRILEILKENDVKAVFFVVGEKAMKYPEIIEQIIDEGHLIGNHTYTHPPLFALFSGKRVKSEIVQCEKALKDRFGITPSFFRPPIGYTNPIIGRVVRELNVQVMGWSFRSWDTVLRNPKLLLRWSERGLKPGNILLFHDTLNQTVHMLPELLALSAQKGLNFTDVNSFNNEMDA